MDVGIGVPSTIPAAGAATVVEWARRADSASFSSVPVLDRIVMNADLNWLRQVNPRW